MRPERDTLTSGAGFGGLAAWSVGLVVATGSEGRLPAHREGRCLGSGPRVMRIWSAAFAFEGVDVGA
jgi:hypothetical protein